MVATDVRDLVRRYQVHLVNTGGNDPVDLLEEPGSWKDDPRRAFCAYAVQSQVGLLVALRRAGLLREAAPRKCFWIAGVEADGGFVPSLVIEGQAGHQPMLGGEGQAPWVWGKTLEEARRVCAEVNRSRFGLSRAEAAEIVASSFAASAWQEEVTEEVGGE